MLTTEDICIGQLVKSTAGRDKGKIFVVIGILDDKYVNIVDGDLRKLNNLKKKKIKHLAVYNIVLTQLQDKIDNNIKINNAYIRKLLATYKA